MPALLVSEPFGEQLDLIDRLRAAQAVSHSQGSVQTNRRRGHNQNGHHGHYQSNQSQQKQFFAAAAAAAAVKQSQTLYPASVYSQPGPSYHGKTPSHVPMLYHSVDLMNASMASQNGPQHQGPGFGQRGHSIHDQSPRDQIFQNYQHLQNLQREQAQQAQQTYQSKQRDDASSEEQSFLRSGDMRAFTQGSFTQGLTESQASRFGAHNGTFGIPEEMQYTSSSAFAPSTAMASHYAQDVPSVFSTGLAHSSSVQEQYLLSSQHSGARSQSPSAQSLFSTRTSPQGHPSDSLGGSESPGGSEPDLTLGLSKPTGHGPGFGHGNGHPENLSQSSLLRSIWMAPPQTDSSCGISLTSRGKW